jgi:WD40 repeat protein
MAFDPSSKRLVAGFIDGSVTVLDTVTGKKVAGFQAPREPPAKGKHNSYDRQWSIAVCFSADGRSVAVVDLHGLRLLELASQKEIARLSWQKQPTLGGRAFCATFSSDRNTLAVGWAKGNINLWDLSAVRQKNPPPAQPAAVIQTCPEDTPEPDRVPVYALVFSPDSRLLGACMSLGELKVWEHVPR